MRDELLAEVQNRITRFLDEGDLDAVSSEDADNLAQRLLASLRSPASDLEVLRDVGWLYWCGYLALPEPRDGARLMAAVRLFEPVYRSFPDAVPDQVRQHFDAAAAPDSKGPEALVHEATELVKLAVRTGDSVALDTAIDLLQRVVDDTALNHSDRASTFNNLATTLQIRFLRTGSADDLDQAIDTFRQAVDATPTDHPRRSKYLSDLGDALHNRLERTGSADDLNQAVNIGRQAVGATPTDHPNRPRLLSNLGLDLHTQFRHTDSADDLNQAIDTFRQAVDATPTDDPTRPTRLSNLEIALHDLFQRTGSADDLNQAIDIGREAVATAPTDHPDRPRLLSNLGLDLHTQFQRTDSADDLNQAIDTFRQAVDATPTGHADRPRNLSILGIALRTRFQRTGSAEDLNQLIDTCRQAVNATPTGHPTLSQYLSDLGNALHDRFERAGSAEDLDQVIDIDRQAVDATPTGHADRPGLLSNLGLDLQTRFQRTDSADDLNQAIDAHRQAVNATPTGHPDRPRLLAALRDALHTRSERTGSADDLDQAIDIGRQAIDASPVGHPNRPGNLSRLGVALRTRVERTGSADDLDQMIRACRQAVDASPVGHPDRAGFLTNLVLTLRSRYRRTGSADDLDQAIDIGRQAINATPTDHADLPNLLTSLEGALHARFERTGSADDLDQAIDIGRQAIDATPTDHPDRPSFLANLGIVLRTRLERTGSADDLEEAIDIGRQAIDATPTDHPTRPKRLSNLGLAFRRRFERTGSMEDLDQAMEAFREAATVHTAPVVIRALAARQLGQSAVLAEKWAEAVEGFSAAVELVGMVASRDLGRADQEFMLGSLAGLATEAAAACVQAGQPERAVELFEQGRGVLFTQVLDARSDLTNLQQEHPDLADRFARWRDALDRPDPGSAEVSADDADPSAADRRRDAAAEFDRILRDIRGLPRFERFLMPRRIAELLTATEDGPVVLLSIAPLRSDALILTPNGVEVLPLEGIDPAGLIEQANAFLVAIDAVHARDSSEEVRSAAEDVLGGVLGWLGDHVTGPVLNHLGYTSARPAGLPWPRVWWCPSGALSLLPLHAAGEHNPATEMSNAVIDRVISSTVPTVRALQHARRITPTTVEPWALVVAMPHTPDQPDLPGVANEAATLQHLLGERVDVLGLNSATPATYDSVTDALPGRSWVHFACHGASDLNNPSASHLLLADYRTRPLTVMDLTRAHLQGAELAFLSACTTSRTGAALLDEPIHLAAACQLAGYRHVVASLWPIGDADTAWLTKRFYTTLATTPGAAKAAAAADALHLATRGLRATNRNRPSRWAPYTHTGP
ncbi:CHAT domain-containing protein [Rhodococcus opacus]|uniref:CHAT domain-containing protein n=1 Tax=Rhodococcus opacus TaxID=37919 RepID=A0AAX3YT33_RHOOP|nr:CHAT domain-containing protein [Rhodococcus opacus]MCZ4587713.1 CHAT domain-containing protein [Rhodococcus opacus]WLF51292.1 CHAT domain-containing protein [Rhodococcus opacus]